ncbi:NUDIX domain-containing protein [Nonomuraea sp. NPDC049129]|uniref:NUDIX domain-containing protein n=1 Tax=Nonomuraea sp. NPDC049129 TaxID=3155272 RepID=UPI0033F2E609
MVIDDDGRVLLHRRRDCGLWALPGGVMDVGETVAAAVVREKGSPIRRFAPMGLGVLPGASGPSHARASPRVPTLRHGQTMGASVRRVLTGHARRLWVW